MQYEASVIWGDYFIFLTKVDNIGYSIIQNKVT